MFSIITDVLVFTSIVDDTAQNFAMKRKTTREKKKNSRLCLLKMSLLEFITQTAYIIEMLLPIFVKE